MNLGRSGRVDILTLNRPLLQRSEIGELIDKVEFLKKQKVALQAALPRLGAQVESLIAERDLLQAALDHRTRILKTAIEHVQKTRAAL